MSDPDEWSERGKSLGGEPSRMTDSGDEDRPETPAADVFAAVADQTRIDILRALWDLGESMPFSELQATVGVKDGGRFNYHLGELVGRFVRRTGDGYELTFAGEQFVGALYSGTYTESADMSPLEVGTCPTCDGRLEATYKDETVTVTCDDCGRTITRFGAPPGLVAAADRSALPQVLSNWVHTSFQRTARGFCTYCSGQVRPSIGRDLWEQTDLLGARYDCESCGATFQASIAAATLDHPEVVAFNYEHGIDLNEDRIWEVPWLFDFDASVESETPLRVEIRVEFDDDPLVIHLGPDLRVTTVSRPN
jgi:DNA-binding transcriptional ArsR family regulator